jgi:hypothetical protein
MSEYLSKLQKMSIITTIYLDSRAGFSEVKRIIFFLFNVNIQVSKREKKDIILEQKDTSPKEMDFKHSKDSILALEAKL